MERLFINWVAIFLLTVFDDYLKSPKFRLVFTLIVFIGMIISFAIGYGKSKDISSELHNVKLKLFLKFYFGYFYLVSYHYHGYNLWIYNLLETI